MSKKLHKTDIRSGGFSTNKISVIEANDCSSVNKTDKHGHSQKISSNDNLNHSHQNHHKESHLAHQFIIINCLEIASMITFMLLSLNNFLHELNENFYFLRQLMRILNLTFLSLIPIISLVFNPNFFNYLKKLRTCKS